MSNEERMEGELLQGIAAPQAEAAALGEMFRELHDAEEIILKRGSEVEASAIVMPRGRRLVSLKKYLDEYRKYPERKRGTALLTTLDAFLAHFQRYADEDSAIFCDMNNGKPRLISLLDYDKQGPDGHARWGTHRGLYEFPLSDEFNAWKASHGREMTSEMFASFLEERIIDVAQADNVDPDSLPGKIAAHLDITWASPQRLMELSRGLSLRIGLEFAEVVDNKHGMKNVVFKENMTQPNGEPLLVPSGFLIRVPIFKGDERWLIPAQLRFRPKSEKKWKYEIYRLDMHLQEAVERTCEHVVKVTQKTLFMGLPEHMSSDSNPDEIEGVDDDEDDDD